MNRLMTAALAAGVAIAGLAVPSIAQAREGCGPGWHRGPAGGCRPNARPGPVVHGPVLVIGRYYPGRGYWYNNRYWRERYRHHGYWRYR